MFCTYIFYSHFALTFCNAMQWICLKVCFFFFFITISLKTTYKSDWSHISRTHRKWYFHFKFSMNLKIFLFSFFSIHFIRLTDWFIIRFRIIIKTGLIFTHTWCEMFVMIWWIGFGMCVAFKLLCLFCVCFECETNKHVNMMMMCTQHKYTINRFFFFFSVSVFW